MVRPAPPFTEEALSHAFRSNIIRSDGLSIPAIGPGHAVRFRNLQFQFSRSYRELEAFPGAPNGFHDNGNRIFVPRYSNIFPKITFLPNSGRRNYPELENSIFFLSGRNNYEITCWGSDNFVYVDQSASLPSAKITCGSATVFIGPKVRSTAAATFSARNGGSIILREDILLASNVQFYTDDMHGILDLSTGRRLNPFGGRIEVGSHVWLGRGVEVYGDTIIQDHVIVGTNSFVRNKCLPEFTTCAGSPAKIVREGTTWHPDDLPQDDENYRRYVKQFSSEKQSNAALPSISLWHRAKEGLIRIKGRRDKSIR